MKIDGNTISISATDLVGRLNCAHLTELDLAVARGQLTNPAFTDPFRELLQERGSRHEQNYIEHLKARGLGDPRHRGRRRSRRKHCADARGDGGGRGGHRAGRVPLRRLGRADGRVAADRDAVGFRAMVLRSRRHETCARNQGRNRPATLPLRRAGRRRAGRAA